MLRWIISNIFIQPIYGFLGKPKINPIKGCLGSTRLKLDKVGWGGKQHYLIT